MNIETYRERRRLIEANAPKKRELCTTCFQPTFSCYCEHVRRFDPRMQFVVLIHPIEKRRRIATGRMSFLTLENSKLILGQEYSGNREVDEIVNNPLNHCVLLYPGVTSRDLTKLSVDERSSLVPGGKNLVVFVVDGTWNTARKMVRSLNLRDLPRICFTPERESRFRVRKQPAPGCFSTIEAIHQTIELIGHASGFDVASRTHDALLDVFDVMVERQLKFVESVRASRHNFYRRDRTHQSVGK